MYKRLTIAYSTFCRGKNTPLSGNWEAENDGEAEEHDSTLNALFSQLQPAYVKFCE